MPSRPRSHQLEDISITHFRALLPTPWVCREKGKDYGVDLEIEIFDDDGASTGLSFYVQIRATDKSEKSKNVTLTIEQVDYFLSLDVDTIVVRYFTNGNKFHWQWAHNIQDSAVIKPNQKSFTHKFSDKDLLEDHLTFTKIRETLALKRRIKNYPFAKAILVQFDTSVLEPETRYKLDRMKDELVSTSNGSLTLLENNTDQVLIVVRAMPEALVVEIPLFTSITFDFNQFNLSNALNSIRYAICATFRRHKLVQQADQMARAILTEGARHEWKNLAIAACFSLSSDLFLSAKLAVKNELHKEQDEYYMAYTRFLFSVAQGTDDRYRGLDYFYEQALAFAKLSNLRSVSAIHYSIGNSRRARSDSLAAIVNFNRARKLRPSYMKADYFLREMGSCFFMSGRYAWAAKLYSRALEIAPTEKLSLYLADALLFSGEVGEAKLHFTNASMTTENFQKVEALVKIQLCEWLEAYFDSTVLKSKLNLANQILQKIETSSEAVMDSQILKKALFELDSLNPVLHFNIGIDSAKGGNHHDALGHFLFCAFKHPNDNEAWSNALLSAFNLGEFLLFQQIINCAISLGGTEAYDYFREQVREKLENSIFVVLIQGLDDYVKELKEMAEASSSDTITLRILSDNGEFIAHEAPKS